jgi:hypothetical protein
MAERPHAYLPVKNEDGSKTRYSRRKVVWNLMERLIAVGRNSPKSAADLIYQVYGQNLSVTGICGTRAYTPTYRLTQAFRRKI